MDVAITTMSSKGQVVIPASMRADLPEGVGRQATDRDQPVQLGHQGVKVLGAHDHERHNTAPAKWLPGYAPTSSGHWT